MIELAPIRETTSDYDLIESAILRLFRDHIYIPLLKEMDAPRAVLKNSLEDLLGAITSGRITFYRGVFRGKFNATTSKELKRMGAKWDKKSSAWKLPLSSTSDSVRHAIGLSESRFDRVLKRIDQKLESLLPEEIAGNVQLSNLFEKALWKVEKNIQKTLKNITIAPKLTEWQAKRISDDYTTNMKLYIKDWTEKEIIALRQKVQTKVFAGNRYESMVKTIQRSYGVSQNKAKFLARQETSLLMTKFKESRYTDAGVKKYKWGCVAGSSLHPVRIMHKVHEGKVFSWDSPPVVNLKGERKNPGQDYNCRCFARPIVEFHR